MTLSPRYFGVPLYQTLKFIKIQYVQLLNKNRCNVNKHDGNTLGSNEIKSIINNALLARYNTRMTTSTVGK